ncbi:MAG: hypothetical protein Q9187_004008 [Circinaria calcarea]
MNGRGRHQSVESSTVASTPEGSKRKGEDGLAVNQSRAKRNRYVSIACSECKRRKVKCNGETPCLRCGNLSLECLYVPNCCSSFKDSEEFRQLNNHIQSLQEQVNHLYAILNSLHQTQVNHVVSDPEPVAYRHVPIPPPRLQAAYPNPDASPDEESKAVRFRGPTSSAFNFDIANTSLQTMGITTSEYIADEGLVTQDATPPGTPPRNQAPLAQMAAHPTKDPLWTLGRDEVLRLCRVYEDEVGIMYPILDIERIISKAKMLFDFMESATRTGLLSAEMSGSDSLNDDDSIILKMVLAVALTVEGSGQSELGQKLFGTVQVVSGRRLWQPVTVKGLILLVIVAEYYFHLDEEARAYRIIGLAARMCFEMGLHRREVLTRNFVSENDCSWAVRLFWSIYVLDRRWSFGTGMPFGIQDSDIDASLPEPDEGTPYLVAMVAYGRISSRVWRSVTALDSVVPDIRQDEIGYLDYQIQQWQMNIPESLHFSAADNCPGPAAQKRAIRRLRVLLYLRTNQLRIMIYRPVLHSATSIMENRAHAQTVVEVAKDTVRVLTRLNQTSDIYRTQQVCFNYFLLSALAVLFLGVSHAPVEFSRQVRDEFYMALDLVKGFSTKSYVSKRLWKTIKGLKEVGPRLGLVTQTVLPDDNDPHSSAAVAMAGLAGHSVDELALFSQSQGPRPASLGSSPRNGQQMSYELTNLFEAAGAFSGTVMASESHGVDGMDAYIGTQRAMTQPADGVVGIFGNEEDFARIMRDLF